MDQDNISIAYDFTDVEDPTPPKPSQTANLSSEEDSDTSSIPEASDQSSLMERPGLTTPQRKRKRRILWIVLLLLGLVVAISITVGVIVSSKDESSSQNLPYNPSRPTTATPIASPVSLTTAAPSNSNPTLTTSSSPTRRILEPTDAPVTLDPTQSPRPTPSDVLFSILRKVTPPATLLDSSTPQYQAWQWMLRSDQIPQTQQQEGRLLQRYAATTLTFSLARSEDTMVPLRLASLSECQWTGVTCSDSLAIERIQLASFNLSGVIPNEIGALSNLEYLDLAENQLRGSIPNGIYNISSLKFLYLFSNQLTGTLNEDITQLSQLEEFMAGENRLSGSIPAGLGDRIGGGVIRPLRKLSLYKNRFSGRLPTAWRLRRLFLLDLGHNLLTGPVPAEWAEGSLIQLRLLYLDNNQLIGSIPASFPNSIGDGRLASLSVNNNQLTGTVPGNYSSTVFLESLEIQNNQFTSLSDDICEMIVFDPRAPGELVNFRADCSICTCDFWCETDRCYA